MPETDTRITDVKLLFSATLLAGEILLSSGAEIYRVEDTISRLLALSGYAGGESFVTPSCILLTLRTPDSEAMTTLKRVPVRENNLSRVAETNTVARALTDGKISLEEAYRRLVLIREKKGFPVWVKPLVLLFLPVCFFLFFGGRSLPAAAICLLTGAWLALSANLLIRQSVVPFFQDLIRAAGVAFLASLAGRFLSTEDFSNLIIISSIMPLVPGVAITTAIRDVLHGDYQSGTARAAEAFIIASAVAVGVGAGIFLYRLIPL